MKNPLSSQTVGKQSMNQKLILSATKLEKNLQKTAKSCGYLIFFCLPLRKD